MEIIQMLWGMKWLQVDYFEGAPIQGKKLH
jgi:hypothetical protein